MSYILDALRKADAQRERDASRGIHAQAPSLGGTSASGAARAPVAMWAALAIAVAVIAAAGWYFTRTTAKPVEATASTPATPLPMQAPVVPPAQESAPVANVISPPPPPAAAPMHTAPPSPQQGPVQAPSTPPAFITNGLPPDAPKVAITGGVYSPNPAQRMLIVNGQVFNEGSEIAPGLSIDRIEPRTAVLKFRDARYSVAY